MDKKTEMTSLDLAFLVPELKEFLTNGVIRKIYQYKSAGEIKDRFLIEVYNSKKGESFWLYFDKNKAYLSEYKKKGPTMPPNFCLFLRKHLNNQRIKNIRQYDFDRILEIKTETHTLIIELFSNGNVILCDNLMNIIMPLYMQKWKDRNIIPKTPYKYPPSKLNPFGISFDYFHVMMKKSEKKLVVFLASFIGFGSVYAKEICKRAGLDENMLSKDVSIHQALPLFKIIESIKHEKIEPVVYQDYVAPFPLKIYEDKRILKTTKTFSEAMDEFFLESEMEAVKEMEEKTMTEEKKKIERIIERQEESLEKWNVKKDESKEIGDTIYAYYSIVEGVLSGIRKAKEMGMPWSDIKEKIKREESPEADAIKEIREDEGVVIVELGGKEIELDFRKSVEENAEDYYEGSKKAKKKIPGIEKAMIEQKEKFEHIEETESEPKPVAEFTKKKRKGKWYEKFRWFYTSDGFLVVAGKDATSNEVLIKKHTEQNDLVFHADIPGAAFVTLKYENEEITDIAKKEAAEFSAAYSRAWQRGLGNIDVYCVKPDQVSKQPPSGEYLPKGSFMIYGQREWFRETELKLSIGVKIDRDSEEIHVIAGPVMATRTNSDYFVTIRPGDKSSDELARLIKNAILIKASPEDKIWIEKVPLDEFQKWIPSGQGEIVESFGV